MAHHYSNSMYDRLAARLNRFPQGAPPSEHLFAVLRILFSEQEAGLAAQLPIKPFTAATAAAIWKTDTVTAQKRLDALADRAVLLDMDISGTQHYCLPPPMAGFFEFSMMRVRNDIDQKTLSELYYQYLNVEEDFIKALFADVSTPLGRIFAHETVLDEDRLEVLDYERASHIVNKASHIGISMCYCRHKMQHLGKACDAPMDICMTFNTTAASLIKHGHARPVDKAECLDLLDQARECGLVQFGENVREGVNFICNCCGCCCEALGAVKRFAVARTIRSNFVAALDEDTCRGCGKCVKTCPVEALAEPHGVRGTAKVVLDAERCLGCGVCVRSCTFGALRLDARPGRTITPLNTVTRVVAAATEKGLLGELVADNSALLSHRILAAVIGAILKLPGTRRAFAAQQLKSRYLERLIARMGS